MVYVYDEKGVYMFSRQGVLVGFTATTLSVRDGSVIKVYDEKGSFKFSK